MIKNWDAIIVTADEPYSGMNHTQVLYANYLSRVTKVIYVQPPAKWHLFKFLRLFRKPQQVNKQLRIHTYVNVMPSSLKIGKKINEKFNEEYLITQLRGSSFRNILIWHFDSYRSVFSGNSISDNFRVKHLYHVIDPFFRNPENDILCAISEKIIITSPRNNSHYKKYLHKVLNIPQVADLEEIKNIIDSAKPGVTIETDYLVLIGTISDDLDFGLLSQIAEIHTLYIAGSIKSLHHKPDQWEHLLKSYKVHYKGFLKPEQFYPLISRARAGLICYDLKIRSGNFSPLKALNYLAAGIPVISNCDTEIEALKGKMVFEHQDHNDFVEQTKHIISGKQSPDFKAGSEYLKNVSIGKAIQDILASLSN